jgi:hypothetical protein
MRGTDEWACRRLRWQRLSSVAARSKGDATLRGLCAEPTDNTTLGAHIRKGAGGRGEQSERGPDEGGVVEMVTVCHLAHGGANAA